LDAFRFGHAHRARIETAEQPRAPLREAAPLDVRGVAVAVRALLGREGGGRRDGAATRVLVDLPLAPRALVLEVVDRSSREAWISPITPPPTPPAPPPSRAPSRPRARTRSRPPGRAPPRARRRSPHTPRSGRHRGTRASRGLVATLRVLRELHAAGAEPRNENHR